MSPADSGAPSERRARDDLARRRAQREFLRPLLVEAGAGTGKTSVLVTRVLAWCLGGGWERAAGVLAGRRGGAPEPETVAARVLDRIVAITFTEAAAAEMEERIATGLQALAVDGAGREPLDPEALPSDPDLRRTRARALLAAFDRLRVSTIHAFCRRLLAEHPQEAGLPPRFTVDAAGVARAAAARAAIEEWLFDPARADDPDLLALVEDGVAAPELEAALEAMLATAIDPGRFAEDPLAPPHLARLVARLDAALGAFVAAGAGRLLALRGRSNGREVAEAAAASLPLLTADGGGLAVLLAQLRLAWPERAQKRLATFAEGRLGDRERAALGEAQGSLVTAARSLAPLLQHALGLDLPRLARTHRVVATLYAEAFRRMHAAGAVGFDGLLLRAHELLARRPEVAARERAHIDQLLVDEFQDTDAEQCALVARLALDEEGGPRPGLFVVGDPKQSIYGWRNADLAAYEAFRERLLAAGGERHLLCVNHRSTPAVLDEVARVMRDVMIETPGEQPPFEPLLASGTQEGSGPLVEYWIASNRDDLEAGAGGAAGTPQRLASEREADHLAQDLLRLAREARERGGRFAWERVGILLRSTGDLEVYLAALREAGVPYTVARDRQYASRREVVEARSLVRAVLDPGDQIALVAALRSAWAGVPDVAWRPLWVHGFPGAVRELLEGAPRARGEIVRIVGTAAAAVASDPAPPPGLAALAGWDQALLHALEVLATLRRSFAREPAERFVERVRTLPLLPAGEAARFLGPWRLANLERFFRELGELLEASRGDTASVLRGLRRAGEHDAERDEGRPARPGGDAVQVMTIHAAKGLEFEHVYLLQVHKREGGGSTGAFLAGTGVLAGEWCLGAARVASLGFDEVRSARERIERAERVRTLYVALTRACRRLVVSGHWSRAASHGVHGVLLAAGRGAALEEAAERGRAAGAGWNGVIEHDGALWRFLDHSGRPRETPLSAGSEGALDEARVAADSERLARHRAEALARSQRALAAPVTGDPLVRDAAADHEDDEGRARWRPPSPAPEARAIAVAVGTAIHALLEGLALDALGDVEWEAGGARLRASLASAGLPPPALGRALARANALVERLRSGRLGERLRAFAPHVVARELPVLLRPEGGGWRGEPVGAGVGAIDLVVRDPAHGWTIVDFKTDAVQGRELAARVEHHRIQGLAYRRALAEALALGTPPRVELWFLDADQAVALD
ncbi:MAG: UvrD-helicase domain-containing protein [Deltaproteobacteria bacterium]|nr:UvrD-helicase domain-containing protein [Deltaproteobacteria bacterium]